MTRFIFLVIAFLMCSSPCKAAPLSPDDIVRLSDAVRFPDKDYSTSLTVRRVKPGKDPQVAVYEVLVKGRDYSLVRTLEPASERGRLLLMRYQDLWAYLPTISKPLRLSFRERFFGEVANADVARANFSGDYDATLAKSDIIRGKNYYVLNLHAKHKNVAYAKVVLWVERETFYPLQAQFYSILGKKLKTCSYQAFRNLGGRIRPTRIIMSDAITTDQYTVMDYHSMEFRNLPEKYFTEDYLKKLGR